MSWNAPWGFIVGACAAVAVAFIWVSLKRPDKDRAGPIVIVLALVLFLAALKLFL